MTHVSRHRAMTRHGFTLVEAAVCVLVTGLMLVAAMQVAAASNVMQYKTNERTTGQQLANALLVDVMALEYKDPGLLPLFGCELGELLTSKQSFNDVDDFDGWSETPPQNRLGVVLAGTNGWTRGVKVDYVNVPNVTSVSLFDTGAKRVTVTVRKGSRVVATAVGVRTSSR